MDQERNGITEHSAKKETFESDNDECASIKTDTSFFNYSS